MVRVLLAPVLPALPCSPLDRGGSAYVGELAAVLWWKVSAGKAGYLVVRLSNDNLALEGLHGHDPACLISRDEN